MPFITHTVNGTGITITVTRHHKIYCTFIYTICLLYPDIACY